MPPDWKPYKTALVAWRSRASGNVYACPPPAERWVTADVSVDGIPVLGYANHGRGGVAVWEVTRNGAKAYEAYDDIPESEYPLEPVYEDPETSKPKWMK